jgi:F-type H+-transporting ATPase subunit b
MIVNFLFLAAEAHSKVERGFGLNLDIFETNLINLLILLGVLFYYGRGIVANILNERQSRIAQQIQDVESRLKQASVSLEEENKKLKEAQATAEKIVADAKVNAEKAKAAILTQGDLEVERLKAVAVQDLNSEQEKAIAELRQKVAAMAIAKVESQLKGVLDDNAQQKLIDRSIAQLGGSR